jgi:hypothetical protein
MWTALPPAYEVKCRIKNVLIAVTRNGIILNILKVLVLF